MTARAQPLTTGHPCVRFIKECDYPFDMEYQQNLLQFRDHPDLDSVSQRADIPLNQVAKLTKDGLIKEYITNKKTIKDIAKLYKISINSIRKYLNQYSIQIRTRKDYGFEKRSEMQFKKRNDKYKYIIISDESEQLLIGSLLGDSSLFKAKGFLTTPKYNVAHTKKQEEYLKWKANLLALPHRLYVIAPQITTKIIKNGVSSIIKSSSAIGFSTINLPQLNKYYNMFYPNGKKVVTREILDKLTPLGISIWYFDDGSYSYFGNFIQLSTNCFSFEEHKIIVNWFREKYNINWKIDKFGQGYRLRLNIEDSKKFIELIKPYVLNCMNYKLGLDIKKQNYSIESRKKTHKKYYEKNPEKIKVYKQKWNIKNKEHIREKNRIYRQDNKSKLIDYSKNYYQKNKYKWKEYNKKNNDNYFNENHNIYIQKKN